MIPDDTQKIQARSRNFGDWVEEMQTFWRWDLLIGWRSNSPDSGHYSMALSWRWRPPIWRYKRNCSASLERGLAIPTSDFFRSLLHHWKVQLHHLTPNSILHLSIFTHLCEAFLGIQPHFNLFRHLFLLHPYPGRGKIAKVGRAEISLRPGKERVYLFFFSADHSEYRVEKFLVLCWEPSALASRTGSKFG